MPTKKKVEPLKLRSIKEETRACREAFREAGSKPGDLTYHCHHGILVEVLEEPASVRIAYILSDKATAEKALRLRLFRPVPRTRANAKLADLWDHDDWRFFEKAEVSASSSASRAHKQNCPGCSWDGATIFAGDFASLDDWLR